MKRICLIIISLYASWGVQALVVNQTMRPFRANGVDFGFVPYVTLRQGNHDVQLQFQTNIQAVGDGYVQEFITREMRLELSLYPYSQSDIPLWKCQLTAHFNNTLQIHDLWLQLLLDPKVEEYTGERSIHSKSQSQNVALYPYTDRYVMYKSDVGAIWFIGSNVFGDKPLECIEDKRLKCFDREFHRMDIRYQTGHYFDWLPVVADQEMSWDFVLSEVSPPLVQINRYPKGKKAAFCISSDADCETASRLKAVYFGADHESDSDFGQKGLVAHGLVTSHTVFGENYPFLFDVWNSIQDSGSHIGYHTFSNEADNMVDLRESLLNQLTDYNIRTWIDHSYLMNPEDVYSNGWNPESPYYLFPLFQEAGISYLWTAEIGADNHMNSFDHKERLPHTIPALGLDFPLYLFKRWRTETWEYYTTPQYDFKHNVTAANLDSLLAEGGIAIAYTHLAINPSSQRQGFYTWSNGVVRCLNEADERFAMLADYRDNKDLWICPSEDLFDRMIATEQVWLQSIVKLDESHLSFSFRNSSTYTITELEFTYQDRSYVVSELPVAGECSVIVQYSADWDNDHFIPTPPPNYIVTSSSGTLRIRERNGKSMTNCKLSVYNLRGQRLDLQTNYSNANVEADMTKSGSGVYILKLETPDAKPSILKFVHLK